MIRHRKGAAAAFQIREYAIAAFVMKGHEPLPEQALEIHIGLPHAVAEHYRAVPKVIRPSGRAQSPRP
jgi:hypothetical protein